MGFLTGYPYQIANYLKLMMPIRMIFTMDNEGSFWALRSEGPGCYKWSREEVALFWTEQPYYPEPMYGLSGEIFPVMMSPPVHTDHDMDMAWMIAQQWGGFLVDPMEAGCPVEANWNEWVLFADKDNRRNIKFTLIGVG